jgi:hypothetical protein
MIDDRFYSDSYSSEAEWRTLTRMINTWTGKLFLLCPFAKAFIIYMMLVFVMGNLASHIQSKNCIFS